MPEFRQEGFVEKRTPQNCRWAEPTLYLPFPYWLEAWSIPWSCHRDGSSRLLETTEQCAACPRFEPRCRDGVRWTFGALAPLGH
jgi:hypothetical protein